jgi:hypothetical protein
MSCGRQMVNLCTLSTGGADIEGMYEILKYSLPRLRIVAT